MRQHIMVCATRYRKIVWGLRDVVWAHQFDEGGASSRSRFAMCTTSRSPSGKRPRCNLTKYMPIIPLRPLMQDIIIPKEVL
jgi:hypothetical protein